MLKQIISIFEDRLFGKLIDDSVANKFIPKNLLSSSVTFVTIAMLRWWLGQEKYSEEEAVHMFGELINNGFIQLANPKLE